MRVGYTFFVKETTRMLVDIPGTLSHVNETRRSLYEGGIYIFLVKETMRMLVDIPGTLSYVNETRRSLFEGGIYICLSKRQRECSLTYQAP